MKLQHTVRPIINLLMTFGYLSGMLFVWIGLETLTIEHGWYILGIFEIVIGLVLWTLLNLIGYVLAGNKQPLVNIKMETKP